MIRPRQLLVTVGFFGLILSAPQLGAASHFSSPVDTASALSCAQAAISVGNQAMTQLSSSHGLIRIARSSKEVWVSREWGKGVDSDSRFLLGSISKTLTALISVRLLQGGVMHLDEPIAPILPAPLDHADGWKNLELHQLLDHSSGIPDYLNRDGGSEYLRLPRTFAENLLILPRTLEFTPSTQLSYSNTNYYVIGKLAAYAAQKSYAELFNEQLVSKLNLDSTGLIESGKNPAHFGNSDTYLPNLEGAGSAYSSAADLLKILHALESDDYINHEWKLRMYSPDPLCRGPSCERYGMGLSLRPSLIRGHEFVMHEGHLATVSTMIARIPELDVNLVILTDQSKLELEAIATHYLQKLADSHCF